MSREANELLIAILILVAAVALSWLAGKLVEFTVRRYTTKTVTQLDDVFIQSIRTPIRIAIIVAGIQVALTGLSFISADWLTGFEDIFFVAYLFLIYIALYMLIGGLAAWYGQEVVYNTDTTLDDKFLTFFRALSRIVITVIAFVILLGHFGIEPSALVTTLGISTLAVALAAQETLSDVISGFMILLDQPFSIGDRVELQEINTWGDVVEVGLRSTRILTRDNRLVTVPNSVIGKGLIVNYSDPSTVYRVQTHVGVAYGTDLDEARSVLIEALKQESWVMLEQPIEALMLEFGENALIFRVRCWIKDYVETRRTLDKMNSALYRALYKAEIKLPAPRRDVHLYQSGIVQELPPGKG
jgi:small-conductance mechanosensitive channel